MKSLQVGEFKANFSELLERLQQGESFGIVYAKSKKLVAQINPPKKHEKKKKRNLGLLQGEVEVGFVFADDFKMTETWSRSQKPRAFKLFNSILWKHRPHFNLPRIPTPTPSIRC